MEIQATIAQMARSAQAIGALLTGIDAEQARWRPDEQSWSMLEVICHLLDEEREDFRVRIEYTLYHPERDWPPIDPAGWVVERGYQQRNLQETLSQFQAERQHSLVWLASLDADWNTARRHPAGFELRAGDLLAAWVAHDLLHLRQLIELHYGALAGFVQPYSVQYAGDW